MVVFSRLATFLLSILSEIVTTVCVSSTLQFVWGYDPVPYDDPFFHDLYKELKWKWKVEYQAQLMALRFSAQLSSFLRHRDDYDMVVLYEDILGDPKAVCEELLEVCEVPKEYVPSALEVRSVHVC